MENFKIIADYHTHTTYSDGKGSIEDNVKSAIAKGLQEIGIADHGMGHLHHGLKRKKLKDIRSEVDELKDKYKGQIKIFLGVEANILSCNGDIDVTDEDKKSSYLLQEELTARGFEVEVKRDIYDVPSRVCWQNDIDALQAQYDLVIFNVNAFFVAQWSVPHMLIWASHLFDKKKKLIVNYGSPYFATEYFPEDPTFIEVNTTPTKHSVKMLVDGILGDMQFKGKSILTK